MGLLDDYGIDLGEHEAPSFDIPDDIYEFEIGDVFIQQGTDNKPDDSWIIIDFLLGDTGKSKREWFGLPKDASNPTEKESQKLGFYKNRLVDLGIPEDEVNNVGRDDLVGLRGTLQVFTSKGYQNIKNVRLSTDGSNEFTPEAEEAPAEAPAAKPATRRAAATTAPAQKAAAAGVKANPFAK